MIDGPERPPQLNDAEIEAMRREFEWLCMSMQDPGDGDAEDDEVDSEE